MSIQFSEGFDRLGSLGDLQNLYPGLVMANLTLITDTPFGRGRAIRCPAAHGSSSSNGVPIPVPSPVSEIGVSLHFRIVELPTANNRCGLLSLMEGPTTQVLLSVNTAGNLKVGRGAVSFPATLDDTSYYPALNTWLHLEMKIYVHTTQGRVTVRVNGQQIVDIENVNTREGSTGVVNTISVGAKNSSAGTGTIDFDNIVVWDATGATNNDYPGDCEVIDLMPSADDATADWTLSTGTDGYALIDGTPDGDDEYIWSETVGETSVFDLEDLPVSINRVLAVQPFASARKDDTGQRSVQIGVDSNGTTSDGSAMDLGTSYAELSRMLETDPDTGLPWLPAAVDALKLRVKVAS